MSSYLYPLSIPRGENLLTILTRRISSSSSWLSRYQTTKLWRSTRVLWSRTNDCVPRGENPQPLFTWVYTSGPTSPSTYICTELLRGEGRTMHRDCHRRSFILAFVMVRCSSGGELTTITSLWMAHWRPRGLILSLTPLPLSYFTWRIYFIITY